MKVTFLTHFNNLMDHISTLKNFKNYSKITFRGLFYIFRFILYSFRGRHFLSFPINRAPHLLLHLVIRALFVQEHYITVLFMYFFFFFLIFFIFFTTNQHQNILTFFTFLYHINNFLLLFK
jgi:hypothetical protein